MTTAAAIWDIVLAAADRDDAVRQALRNAIPVPEGAKRRTWALVKSAMPAEAEAAGLHPSAIAGSESGPPSVISQTPGPGGRVPAGACEGSR